MKRVFGRVEAVFDGLYLLTALSIGLFLLLTAANQPRFLAGIMALVLALGDAGHLLPRMAAVLSQDEERWQKAMGRGKLAASLTMTLFYILLWQIGLLLFSPAPPLWLSILVYVLALTRIGLCLSPQNRWLECFPPLDWAIYRNIPFALLGSLIAWLYLAHGGQVPALAHMGWAVILSFAFYLPVVLWAERRPRLGMLMLPKTCAYVWMLVMCLGL